MTDAYVVALVNERAGYLRGCRADRVALVDAELARLDWCVNGEGELVRVSELRPSDPKPEKKADDAPETTDAEPSPEKAVPAAPRRGGPRKSVE